MDHDTFLAHAVRLEHEAHTVYCKSAEVMEASGNTDAAEFFREMAGYAQLHLQSVMKRAGFADIAEVPPTVYVWDKNPAPESLLPLPTVADIIDLESAITLGLHGERRAVAFYASVAQSAADQQTREMAEEFAAEERGHVLALERFLGVKPY